MVCDFRPPQPPLYWINLPVYLVRYQEPQHTNIGMNLLATYTHTHAILHRIVFIMK